MLMIFYSQFDEACTEHGRKAQAWPSVNGFLKGSKTKVGLAISTGRGSLLLP